MYHIQLINLLSLTIRSCTRHQRNPIIMTTESNEEQQQQQQQQQQESHVEEQAPVPTPQGELWVKDVNATGRWGNRSRKEVYCAIVIVILMIGATVAGVLVAVKNSNKTEVIVEQVGQTKVDPITGETVSAYELPVRPNSTIITNQEELDMILNELNNNSVLADKALNIPKKVEELASMSSTDPYVQAAAWITNVDSTNAKEDVVSRFALAVVFYTTGGTSWTEATNWMSSEYHCNWFGVSCCENMVGVAVCKPDSFGQIVELDLYKNNLVGPMPTSVALLPSLHVLYLNKNGLTGSLPGQVLASIKNLSKLYLQYNYLTGTIPTELVNVTGLNTMYIHGNDISGTFPAALCPCTSCFDGLVYFGVDCLKVECSCCSDIDNCFYLNKTAALAQ